MKNKLRLQRAIKSALDNKQDAPNLIPGLLGTTIKGKPRVKVSGRKGFVYVRLHGNLSETIQAYNDQVLQLYDMPVLVQRVQGKGYHYYVTGKDTGRYQNWGGNNAQAQYAQHGNQHSFGIGAGGSDVVWVFKKQFMPLLLYPYSGTSVRVADDWYQWGDVYKHFTGSVINIGTAKPAIIGDSRFVTLYLDGSTNTVKGVTGSLFTSTPFPADVTPYINVPSPSEGIPLSAVLLTSDTVNIAWNNIYDDIRPIFGVGGDNAYTTGTVPTVGQSLYLTDDPVSSTITGSYNYKLMMTDSDPKHEIQDWFTTSGAIIATFIDEYHSVGYVNAGQWSADLLLNAPSVIGIANPFVYVEMWKKKADGTEILISVTPHNAWGGFSGENRYSFVGSVASSVIIESDSKLFIRVRAFHNGSVGATSWLGIYVNKEANSTINLPASPFYGGGHVIEWNGTPITQRGYANFVGAGIQAYDDGTDTVISIPGTVSIFDDGAFKVSGTAISFGDGLKVHVTGSYAYVDITGTFGHVIQDDGVAQTKRDALNFVGAGFAVYDSAGATIVSGTASGGGSSIAVYDNEVLKTATVEEIDFTDGISVGVSGTSVFVRSHAVYVSYSGTSKPPTETELISLFGSPSSERAGQTWLLNDNNENLHEYFVTDDGTHYWISILTKTVSSAPVVTVNSITTLVSGTNWYGRAALEEVDNLWILCYRDGSKHYVNDGHLHIKFSEDYGVTWTAEDTYIDSNPVGGFPMNPPDCLAGEDAGEPWLYKAPNGNLILHMWRVDYGVTTNGTYQSISTDNGATWSTGTVVNFSGIADDNKIFATDDHFIYNGTIYAAARIYNDVTPTDTKNIFIKSSDNGVTWEYVSDMSPFATDTQEVGFEYIGDNTIVAILRDLGNVKTYRTYSRDMGATWETLVDITSTFSASGRLRIFTRSHIRNKSNFWLDGILLAIGFELMSPGNSIPRRNAIWISVDRGTTWTKTYVDAQTDDAGYGDIQYNPLTNEYIYITYFGTQDRAQIRQYNLSIAGI